MACKLGSEKGGSEGKKEPGLFLTVVIGNLYKIEKKKVPIGRVNKLKKTVSIADTSASSQQNPEEEERKGVAASADYHVAGLGEENNMTTSAVTATNLRLLPSDASLDNIESRMTSVSLGAANSRQSLQQRQGGASLANVLK